MNIIVEQCRAQTRGLAQHGHPDLRVEVADESLVPEAERFLRFVAEYLMRDKARILSGQTLAYGYWLTKFVSHSDAVMEVWEYNANATDFVPGATLTLTYWRDQHDECEKHSAEFTPPRPDRLVVISAGVLEGDPLEGVRYPSPEHMSGWWFTTKRYSGDVKSLRREHLHHVTAARPELARYIALPFGYCFKLEDQSTRVWFESDVAAAAPA